MYSFVSPFVRTGELGNSMTENLLTCAVSTLLPILAPRVCLGGEEKGWRLSNSVIPFIQYSV